MRVIVGYMREDQLDRLRRATILIRSAKCCPQHYTRIEVEEAVRADIDIGGEIQRDLEIPATEDVDFDLTTGAVLVGE